MRRENQTRGNKVTERSGEEKEKGGGKKEQSLKQNKKNSPGISLYQTNDEIRDRISKACGLLHLILYTAHTQRIYI